MGQAQNTAPRDATATCLASHLVDGDGRRDVFRAQHHRPFHGLANGPV